MPLKVPCLQVIESNLVKLMERRMRRRMRRRMNSKNQMKKKITMTQIRSLKRKTKKMFQKVLKKKKLSYNWTSMKIYSNKGNNGEKESWCINWKMDHSKWRKVMRMLKKKKKLHWKGKRERKQKNKLII